jgi:hypothetical protein
MLLIFILGIPPRGHEDPAVSHQNVECSYRGKVTSGACSFVDTDIVTRVASHHEVVVSHWNLQPNALRWKIWRLLRSCSKPQSDDA